jgi:hypothetical protein
MRIEDRFARSGTSSKRGTHNPHRKTGMEWHIESCGREFLETLLWILVLGGIAAVGKPERYWFVSQISIVGMESLKIDWSGVEDNLTTFL